MSAPLKHDFAFDPSYGYDQQRLLEVGAPEEPGDFERFWRGTYEQARAAPLEISRWQIASPWPQRQLWEVEFNSLDGVRIGGWMTLPACGPVTGGFVVGHGYGGRESADGGVPVESAAAIYPCARGFNRSAHPQIPGVSDKHVVCGIESRETYVHRGCVADIWCAASALIELVPESASSLHYMGGSFGGGIGAMAVAWEKRFRRAFLDVPSFGNHPVRLGLPCVGSGEAVRRYHREHPQVVDVLRYFDAATAARYITIPTLVAAALFDPAVPPPGQFAVYNAIRGRKRLFVRRAAHFEHPDQAAEERELQGVLREWFAHDACP